MPVNDPEYPILEPMINRWSPYRFLPKPIDDGDLLRCLEAARWAASSFNDQPWSWIIARRQDEPEFEKMIGCLMEANQGWAANAGAILLTVTRGAFRYNGKPNRVALHDLGQAAAQMALQATALGLQVHQMAGINLSLIRQRYSIPEEFEPQTAIAIGFPDTSEPIDEFSKQMAERESGPREREPLGKQVFGETWGKSAVFIPSSE